MNDPSPTEFKRDLSGLKGLGSLPAPPVAQPRQPEPPAAIPQPSPAHSSPSDADSAARENGAATTATPSKPGRATTKPARRRASQPAEGQAIPTRGDKALFTITLTASLRRVFKETADADGVPYGEWFLDAFDNQYENLDSLFAPPPARRSPLPPKRPAARRRTDEGSPPIQLYMDIEAAQVVEDAREARQGVSRAAFCGLIIEAELKNRGVAVQND